MASISMTPLGADFFSRYFANLFDEKLFLRLPTLAQSFFGRPETQSYTIFSEASEDIDIDIVRGYEKLAVPIQRGMAGRVFGSTKFDVQVGQATTTSRVFPLIEQQTNIGAGQLNKRIPGEGPYEALDKSARLRELARRGYMDILRMIIRLQEVMAFQSLTLGVQSVLNMSDTTTNIYDWRRNSGNNPSLSHGWGNAAGTPMTDIDAQADQQLFTGKLIPNGLLLGGTAMRMFQANTQVSTNFANKLYFELLRFGPKIDVGPEFQHMIDAGAIPYGILRTPKGYDLTVFTYPRVYDSGTGTTRTSQKYFPDTGALMFSTEARFDRYFGPAEKIDMTSVQIQQVMERFGFNPMVPPLPQNIEQANNSIIPQQFHVDSYENIEDKTVALRVQAAPMFPTTQTDALGYFVPGVSS